MFVQDASGWDWCFKPQETECRSTEMILISVASSPTRRWFEQIVAINSHPTPQSGFEGCLPPLAPHRNENDEEGGNAHDPPAGMNLHRNGTQKKTFPHFNRRFEFHEPTCRFKTDWPCEGWPGDSFQVSDPQIKDHEGDGTNGHQQVAEQGPVDLRGRPNWLLPIYQSIMVRILDRICGTESKMWINQEKCIEEANKRYKILYALLKKLCFALICYLLR